MSLSLLLNIPEPDLEPVREKLREDVARLLRARTFTQGAQQQAFSDRTDPPLAQVDKLIDDAASDVAAKTRNGIPTAAHDAARRVVALGTALFIELGARDYNERRYRDLKAKYDERLAALVDDVSDAGGQAGMQSPVYSFPSIDDCSHVPGSEVPWP